MTISTETNFIILYNTVISISLLGKGRINFSGSHFVLQIFLCILTFTDIQYLKKNSWIFVMATVQLL